MFLIVVVWQEDACTVVWVVVELVEVVVVVVEDWVVFVVA
jgi:hypothetical protein